MTPGHTYLDSSALAKIVNRERESGALARRLRGARLVTSALARVEVARAARRLTTPPRRPLDEVLRAVTVVAIDDDVLLAAAELEPAQLRTRDAIHLATALRVEQELDGFITYDRRLGDAAVRAGLPVEAPADRPG
jgi:predicted nucleic acid-binding protein